MRIHSDILTQGDLHQALVSTGLATDGVYIGGVMRHGVYAVRGRENERTGPPVPLFASVAFEQMRGQTSMDTDNPA